MYIIVEGVVQPLCPLEHGTAIAVVSVITIDGPAVVTDIVPRNGRATM